MAKFTALKKVELTNSTGFQRRYTVADATAISKNKLLTLSDARTAAENTDTPTLNGLLCAGISAMDKEASDGATSITAYTDGIFEIRASGGITVGQPVKMCGANEVMAAITIDTVSGVICGYALETASDQEIINVRLRI